MMVAACQENTEKGTALQVRKDLITSAKIDTAMIFERMLGPQDALIYLRSAAVPEALVERLMSDGGRRPAPVECGNQPALRPAPNARLAEGFYSNNGRRKDVVKSAVVQAALSLREQLGSERMERMLKREALPDDVIARVVCGDDNTLRARCHASPTE
jgi:hypothetical protein